MFRRALALSLAIVPALARAETLESLLARGPMVLVENDAKGKFLAATGIISVDAPLDREWATIIDFAKYKEFVPKVVGTKIVEGAGTYDPHVRWALDTPVFNTVYTVHYHVNDTNHVINAEQVGGALKDSRWEWRVEAAGPGRTLIYYKSQAKHFSAFVESVEDSQQTITIGVNVGGDITLLRAIKERVEKTH